MKHQICLVPNRPDRPAYLAGTAPTIRKINRSESEVNTYFGKLPPKNSIKRSTGRLEIPLPQKSLSSPLQDKITANN